MIYRKDTYRGTIQKITVPMGSHRILDQTCWSMTTARRRTLRPSKGSEDQEEAGSAR
jgi:hypothetical protein